MFGLSNNKQDNQDDQVMLKNVSQLATDLNSTSTQGAQTAQPGDDSARSGFPAASSQTQSDDQNAAAVDTEDTSDSTKDSQAQTESAEQASPAAPPSSFSFPDTSSQPEEPAADNTYEKNIESPLPTSELEQPTDEEAQDTPTQVEPEPINNPPVTNDEASATATAVESSNEQSAAQPPLSAPIDKEKLDTMKQQAIEHLDPLVDHLEHSPEETFKTTMMMIQANDNHTLLDKAFEAAKLIADDKLRAQAMLDIINEINYFSQGATDENPAS